MARKSKESEEEPEDDKSTDEPEEENSKRTQWVGLGLIASVIVGYSPLRDAIEGNGSFENAMLRFLACFVACIFAASVLGRMIEAAPEPVPEGSKRGGTRAAATGAGFVKAGDGSADGDRSESASAATTDGTGTGSAPVEGGATGTTAGGLNDSAASVMSDLINGGAGNGSG